MPPEQLNAVALGNDAAGSYDQRSDIYSLGVVLYEGLTGRIPFAIENLNANREAIARQVLRDQSAGPTPIRVLNPETPTALADIVHRCLQFHPERRTQSANELAACLAEQFGRWRQARWILLKHKRSSMAAGVSVLLLAMSGGWTIARLPPKHERLLQQALYYRQENDLVSAEQALAKALRLDPSYADAQFEIARTKLRQHALLEANEAFFKLESLEPSARSAAYMAYCFNVQGNHSAAIPWYLKSMERGGNAPEVLNNLCCSYELGDSPLLPRKERADSHKYLTEALQQAPDFANAQYNLIRLSIQRAEMDGVPIPQQLPETCRRLIAVHPRCGQALERTAVAYGLLDDLTPQLRTEGASYLTRAIALGEGPSLSKFLSSAKWAPYRVDAAAPTIIEQLKRGKTAEDCERIPLIVEPETLVANPR
jgi:tetratricopeptide (TPR) repeat protein